MNNRRSRVFILIDNILVEVLDDKFVSVLGHPGMNEPDDDQQAVIEIPKNKLLTKQDSITDSHQARARRATTDKRPWNESHVEASYILKQSKRPRHASKNHISSGAREPLRAFCEDGPWIAR